MARWNYAKLRGCLTSLSVEPARLRDSRTETTSLTPRIRPASLALGVACRRRQILSKFSVFGYEEGCIWGAKLQTREFALPGG
jgi:hypothetical protein